MTTWGVRAAILAMAVTSAACAARGGVPRPFPTAALPPGAEAPSAPGTAPADRAAVPPDLPDHGEPIALPAEPPLAATLIDTALSFRGVPYRSGGSAPSGFDCSGFVQYVFAQHGAVLPREVRAQYRVGRQIDLEEVQTGDLVFFDTDRHGASHVGIALGMGRFVHAPSSRGVVRVERYDAPYWARRFAGARRVMEVGAPAADGGYPGSVRSSR